MRINEVKFKNRNIAVFKSIRQDKHTVAQLVKGEIPLIDNNKKNIYTALNNISAEPNRDNIEFLLHVAENLAYGQGRNSKFKDILDKDAITPQNRENTDWELLLQDTISKIISGYKGDDVSDIIDDYQTIFGDKRELSQEQKEILGLRSDLTSQILNKFNPEDEQDLANLTEIRKNLDYFVASSEIPLAQKRDSLQKLVFFMSDDYKITPQLKNRKVKVLDEMLNDLVVKTPENDKLSTKGINQRQSGICAAISICRKDMAYEDKVKYIDLILEELKDSPVMSVYDITELGSGKKVDIPKTVVNYDVAIARGYRVIDASAHLWMHNAHASGDGTLQTEHYIPFDGSNYGVFNDSSWFSSEDEPRHAERELLRALIKEREAIDSFSKTSKQMKMTSQSINSVKHNVFESQKSSLAVLNKIFSSIFPEKEEIERTKIIKSMFTFITGINSDNEVNLPSKLSNDLKKDILIHHVIDSVTDITDEQKNSLIDKAAEIYNMADLYVSSDKELSNLKKFNTHRSKYIYNRKLFDIAAAHRVAIERDVNLVDGVSRFESMVGLPPRDIQISEYLRTLRNNSTVRSVRTMFQDKYGNLPNPGKFEREITSDSIRLESTLPKKIDNIFETLFDKNVTELVKDMYSRIHQSISDGDTEALQNIKMTMNLKGDKKDVLKKLKSWEEKLSNSPENKDVLEAIRLLGYDDRIHISKAFMTSYIQALHSGISEEEFDRLVTIFGGRDKVFTGVEFYTDKFAKIINQYNSILAKWKVPSARELILKRLEEQHKVLPRKQLNMLNHKFMTIQSSAVANEKIQNTKQRNKVNQKLYTFTDSENDIFASIERRVPSMRKYANMQYDNLNDLLYKDLESTYADIGMLNGQFWVREEGSSGLAANEQIRIIEQMTGKPYHIERNINDAVKDIKLGKGSGIISMSVLDDEYAFHAQYVPSVTTETFTDPINGTKSEKDIIWTDNSWGDAEKDVFWNGRNGFEYTDYGNGYGWKDGFILSKDGKIGLPVKDIHGALGYVKEDDEKFGLFTDVLLPGSPVNVYQKLYKVFNYIFNIDEGIKYLDQLEKELLNGYKFSIKELDGIDDIASAKVDKLSKRIEKEINSEEDFDKLSEDDPLKFAFEKLAVYMSTDNPTLAESVTDVTTKEELKEITDNIFEEHLNTISTLLTKTDDSLDILYDLSKPQLDSLFDELNSKFGLNINADEKEMMLRSIFFDSDKLEKHDGSFKGLKNLLLNQVVEVGAKNFEEVEPLKYFIENVQKIISDNLEEKIKIRSFDSAILHNSPLYKELITAVDKYLQPKDDNELLSFIQGLQLATYEESEKVLGAFKPEDVGIRIKKPYDYLLQYKAGNGSVHKTFYEIINAEEIGKNVKSSENGLSSSPEELYRAVMVKLSEMDVQKFIKGFKEEAFKKYKVRQAFPDPVVLSDDDIELSVRKVLTALKNDVDSISSNNLVLGILNAYEKLTKYYIYNPEFQAEISEERIYFDEDNTQLLTGFVHSVADLYELTLDDPSISMITDPLQEILNEFSHPEEGVDGYKVTELIENIVGTFADMEDSGVSKNRFVELNKEEFSKLKSEIKLSVNANIEPKYRDKAFAMLNKLLDMHRKNAPKEDIEQMEDDICDLFVDRHIVKNPTALLREAVKLLMAGKNNTSEYAVMHDYLVQALEVAQQTKIQYKLVQNQHEGISSKTKSVLPLFNVTLANGTKEEMTSQIGMLYLVEKLKNTGDNYKILNLFLQQSGLSKQTLNAVIDAFEIDKTDALITDKSNEIIDDISQLDELSAIVDKYRSMDKTVYSTVEDAMKKLSAYIKRIKPDYKESAVYNKFLYYLDELEYSGTMDSTSESIKNTVIKHVIIDALQYVADGINSEMKYISEIGKMIEERMQLIMSINVPVDCDEYNQRVEFSKRYKQTENYISAKMQEIIQHASESEFLNAQKAE